MKKIKIGVCEKIEFNHEFEIELPESADEDSVYKEIDRTDCKDLVYNIVNRHGGKVLDFIEDGSGDVRLEVEWVD